MNHPQATPKAGDPDLAIRRAFGHLIYHLVRERPVLMKDLLAFVQKFELAEYLEEEERDE